MIHDEISGDPIVKRQKYYSYNFRQTRVEE